MERRKKCSFGIFHQEKIEGDDKSFLFVMFILLCGKCCSSLLTLPGAHPVCEIFNTRIVPLCSDEMMMIHSFLKCIVHFIYLIFFFFPLIILLKMACTTFLADFGVEPTEYITAFQYN